MSISVVSADVRAFLHLACRVSPSSGSVTTVSIYLSMLEAKRSYKLIEYASVQFPFLRSAVPQLVIVVVQTLPMRSELLQAVLVDVIDPAVPPSQRFSPCSESLPLLRAPPLPSRNFNRPPPQRTFLPQESPPKSHYRLIMFSRRNLHTSRTSCSLPPLAHALNLSPPMRLRLTHHVVIIERFASIADEE